MRTDLSMIGSKFRLKQAMLGANVGDIGYVFNQYEDFDYPDKMGVQIIFSNGEYDGFSVREQEKYLEFVGYDLNYIGYVFRSVIQVSQDYSKGYWSW